MKNYKENAHIKSQSKRMENGSEKVVGKKLISYLNIAICTPKTDWKKSLTHCVLRF